MKTRSIDSKAQGDGSIIQRAYEDLLGVRFPATLVVRTADAMIERGRNRLVISVPPDSRLQSILRASTAYSRELSRRFLLSRAWSEPERACVEFAAGILIVGRVFGVGPAKVMIQSAIHEMTTEQESDYWHGVRALLLGVDQVGVEFLRSPRQRRHFVEKVKSAGNPERGDVEATIRAFSTLMAPP